MALMISSVTAPVPQALSWIVGLLGRPVSSFGMVFATAQQACPTRCS